MFFNTKLEQNQKTTHPQKIAFLGVNETSLSLAQALQNIGHSVTFLCAHKQAEEYNATDFIFKENSLLKNTRLNFYFSHELLFEPNFLFITSAPDTRASDFTLLNPSTLSKSTICSFCFPPCNDILTEILQTTVISAYDFAYINWSKNHITNFGRTAITFSLSAEEPKTHLLGSVFENSGIKLLFSEDDNNNLWNYAGVRLIHNFLISASEENISQNAKSDSGRQNIDTLCKEIISLAKTNKVHLSSTDILPRLYEIPNEYISPLQKSMEKRNACTFNQFRNFLIKQTGFSEKQYPTFYKLIQKLYNKY